jgi:hypothetical protein
MPETNLTVRSAAQPTRAQLAPCQYLASLWPSLSAAVDLSRQMPARASNTFIRFASSTISASRSL